MRSALLPSLLALVAFSACGAADTRPETFGDSCTLSATTCVSPYSCADVPELGLRCTLACTDDAACPSFHDTGHCEGDVTSTCLASGFCDPLVCL